MQGARVFGVSGSYRVRKGIRSSDLPRSWTATQPFWFVRAAALRRVALVRMQAYLYVIRGLLVVSDVAAAPILRCRKNIHVA